ncbi:MAG: Gfo/Idh/MocA family oxidoreductase [Alphaproteobacteria bacterium]|nr:MAG: Gfo/Idh/MocA family oxidoreductase [Alphaproteobacteria bacterium]
MTKNESLTRELKAGVVGAGFFGGLHAKKYASLKGTSLVAVMDANPEAAQKLADELGAKAVSSITEMAEEVDLVSIAAPAVYHYPLAKQALEAGLHVYVEKPIALSVVEADELIRLADANNLLLQVGHQERFVFAAFGLLGRNRTPRRIECHRAGTFTGRAMDVSVVLDLMIHDLDLVHQAAPAPVEKIEAVCKKVHGEHEDEVDARLTLSDGCEVRLFASRIADARKRFMKIDYNDGTVEIDFINRTIKNTTGAELESAFESHEEGLPAIADDPLGHAIGAFTYSVRGGEEPQVSGADARRALATALDIIAACQA